jgi:hypothetical protein
MYGLVGVAMHLVVGVLVAASVAVLPTGWMVGLGVLWVAGAVFGVARWSETVWIPLLASVVVSALWMTAFFTNR